MRVDVKIISFNLPDFTDKEPDRLHNFSRHFLANAWESDNLSVITGSSIFHWTGIKHVYPSLP